MKVERFGEDGWLIETDDPLGLAAAIDRTGLDEVVPGGHCVLLRGGGEAVEAALAAVSGSDCAPDEGPPVTLRATWGGPDLADVAHAAGMSPDAVVEVVRRTMFTVSFCGFAPGFAYMTGLPRALHLPRRDRPRAAIPAGSIAIAAGYCAVYPTASPGGWHLIGVSEEVLFDVGADPPALLPPGTRVRFA